MTEQAFANLNDTLDAISATGRVLHDRLVMVAAEQIYLRALEIAPDVAEFSEAMSVDGDDGDALHLVEDDLALWLERHPAAVNVMRQSGEWDAKVRQADHCIAALAIVNEALNEYRGAMSERWDNRPSQNTAPAP